MHKYHKSSSQFIWPFYGLLQHYEQKLQKSYISVSFSPHVSQIVFSAQLTVLRLVTTIWAKTFKMSYHRELSAQVSQILFPCSFDGFAAYYYCMSLIFKMLISPWLQLYELKLQNCHMSVSSVHKYHKSCSSAQWTVLRLVRTVWLKTFKISYLPGIECTSITNRLLSSFDRFTAYYNIMSKNFKNLIFPLVQSTCITNRCSHAQLTVLRLVTTIWAKTFKMSYHRELSAQVSQILFLAHLTVLRLITTVWA